MDDLIIARAIHVVSVVMWIGGVAFVTLVIVPSIRTHYPPEDRLPAFRIIEGRLSFQARIWVLLAGSSGFWMIHRAQAWDMFRHISLWWLHAMVALWAAFLIMLFIVELLSHQRRMSQAQAGAGAFGRLERMHRVVLVLAIVTVVGAVGGSHGLF